MFASCCLLCVAVWGCFAAVEPCLLLVGCRLIFVVFTLLCAA